MQKLSRRGNYILEILRVAGSYRMCCNLYKRQSSLELETLWSIKQQIESEGPEKEKLDKSMLKVVIRNENLVRYFRNDIQVLEAIHEYWANLDPEQAKTDEERDSVELDLIRLGFFLNRRIFV